MTAIVAGITKTADEYREMAAAEYRQRNESFERCDTDGFVSQWANDLTGRGYQMAADIADDGGAFCEWHLERIDGSECHAKLIDGRYGLCWAILDGPGGRFTGEFVTAFPARESTMTRKGYREVQSWVPAEHVAVVTRAPAGARGLSGAMSVHLAVSDMRTWS